MPAQYTSEQLAAMPLEDLEALVMQESANLERLLAGDGMAETLPAAPISEESMMAPAPATEMEEEVGDVAVSAVMDPEVPLDMLSPDLIQAATTALVEAGLMDRATNQMSPDLIQVLQGVADMQSPGIYNLNNDADLMEFVNGIATGIIPIGTAGSSAGPSIPGPAAPPIPGL
tara:strand:+ start:225 stop:743 length:519 start_codon:yes stop_codon:yes gene_type:complete